MDIKNLIDRAVYARNNAYAPYSKFSVGAAVLTCDGKIYTGCNVENASYGASNCAERTAIFKAISDGCRDFKAIAINAGTENFIYPCGICRQVIFEFSKDMTIFVSNKYGDYREISIKELLPAGFTDEDMK